MVTPMTADGAIDYSAAQALAAHLVALGNDGLVVNGTTGEAPTTNDDEKAGLLLAVREAVGSDVTIVAGVGTNNTAHSVALARQAAQAGADGLLAVTPYYSKPSQDGVLAHFTAIADAGDLPVMLYDIPGRAGIPLTVDTLLRVADHPRVVAVKDAKGDLAAATAVLRQTDLLWYSGDDDLNLPFLSIGGTGFVSVTGHVVADRLRDMRDAYMNGEVGRARDLFWAMEPVSIGLFRAPAAALAKAALELQGLAAGPTRLPLLPATPQQREQLALDLRAAGVAIEVG